MCRVSCEYVHTGSRDLCAFSTVQPYTQDQDSGTANTHQVHSPPLPSTFGPQPWPWPLNLSLDVRPPKESITISKRRRNQLIFNYLISKVCPKLNNEKGIRLEAPPQGTGGGREGLGWRWSLLVCVWREGGGERGTLRSDPQDRTERLLCVTIQIK